MAETAALRYMLPWLAADLADARPVMGEDYWTYGLDGNESSVSTLVRYSHEQGLTPREYAPRELFVPEVLEDTVI